MTELEKLRQEARAMVRHAMMLERETRLLEEAGYFDAEGRPRTDAEGKRIWDFVQLEMRAQRPFSDFEVDAEITKGESVSNRRERG